MAGADELIAVTMTQLRSDLAERARAQQLLDATVTIVDSTAGRLLVAATGLGLVRVAFVADDDDVIGHLRDLAAMVGSRILRDDSGMAADADAVVSGLDGGRNTDDLPVDLTTCTQFRRTVLEHLRTIPAGETRSYAQVARAVGRPGAVRAVGTACATNPVPLVIPCHRVVRSDGSIGDYLGGPELKRRLLLAEGVTA